MGGLLPAQDSEKNHHPENDQGQETNHETLTHVVTEFAFCYPFNF
jgi:hypothetical protein